MYTLSMTSDWWPVTTLTALEVMPRRSHSDPNPARSEWPERCTSCASSCRRTAAEVERAAPNYRLLPSGFLLTRGNTSDRGPHRKWIRLADPAAA